MIFTGRSAVGGLICLGTFLALSIARFPVHIFHFSCARTHASIVLSAFLFSFATGDMRPQRTPFFFAFQPSVPREVNIVHVTYVFRLFSVCAAATSSVQCVMLLLSFALPHLSRNRPA